MNVFISLFLVLGQYLFYAVCVLSKSSLHETSDQSLFPSALSYRSREMNMYGLCEYAEECVMSNCGKI